jgi:lysyl-tRNA synthetase class 2
MQFPKCNDSDFIQSIQYNSKTEVLYLKMNGKQYQYFYVPDDIVQGLVLATSKGWYYNRYIKGQYYVLKATNLAS